MKKIFIILIVSIAVTLFTACPEPGSPEADITAILADYIIGEPVIDAAGKTVVLTVEPMDLTGVLPTVTVSTGASVSLPSAIEDGVAAVYTVTSEDGTVVEWTVTVNVAFGVSFAIDGVKTVLLNGCSNSGNAPLNADCGDGVPGIQRSGDTSTGWIHEFEYDWEITGGGEPAGDYVYIDSDGNSTGPDTGTLYFDDHSEGSAIEFDVNWIITEYGELGEIFRSSFTGTEVILVRAGESVLTAGYAKLKVILDYAAGVG